MALTLFISATDFEEYKTISQSLRTDRLEAFIQEAQFSDLRKLVGDEFYADMITNATTAGVWADLFNGAQFTHSGVTKRHFGVKTVLVHFTYARIVMRADVVSTPFGFVRKTNDQSEPVALSERRDIRDEAIRLANDHFELVKDFLDSKPSDFPKWISSTVPFFGAERRLHGSKFSNI